MGATSKLREVTELWATVMKRTNCELEVQRMFYLLADLAPDGRAVPQATLRDRLGLQESTCSRNIAQLAKGATISQPGPRLVESAEDPEYRRRKLVKLTPAGIRFNEALIEIMDRKVTK
jgi:DNA-binding MarR family transcriptional regulator